MRKSDPVKESLMAPEAPFEVVTDGAFRVFRNAPETMRDFFNAAREFGPLEFIVSGDRRLTYDAFFEAADDLASELVTKWGVKAGQSVAICMKNSPEWMMAFVAILNAGAVAVLINSRGTGNTMLRALKDSDSVLVFVDKVRHNRLLASESDIPVIQSNAFPKHSDTVDLPKRKSQDVAAMFFTSGTTGVSKAAVISHRALITGMLNTKLAMAAVFTKMAMAYNISLEALKAQMPQTCSLLVFPLFHTSGCSAVFLTAMSTGGKLVVMDRWDAEDALRLIETERVTTFGGVPSLHWDVLRSKALNSYDTSSLMSISCGGQALPLNLLNEIRVKFPKVFIGGGYGMTECCGAISQANGEAFLANPESSGQVLPMVDVTVRDANGAPVPEGRLGEIWIKGATLMEGYYKKPEETAASMSGAWFKTGDIGRIDLNGYVYIVDRKTDMIISGGENIYCAEIEQVFSKCDGVRQVVAFGVPDERLGERLVLAVSYDEIPTSLHSLETFAVQSLGDYKQPTDYFIQSEPFELNAMGKAVKQDIRKAYLNKLAADALTNVVKI